MALYNVSNTLASVFSTSHSCFPATASLAVAAGLKLFHRENRPSQTCSFVAATPTDPSKPCGVTGTLSSPVVQHAFKRVASADACSQKCLVVDNPECASFGYDAQTALCKTFIKTLENQGFQPGPSEVEYYSQRCFQKKCSPYPCMTVTLTDPAQNYEDNYWTVELPFKMEIYSTKSSTVNITSNGQIMLLGDAELIGPYANPDRTSYYSRQGELPGEFDINGNNTNAALIAALWMPQTVTAGSGQGISYSIKGKKPHRNVTFNWKTGSGASDFGAEYSVFYREAKPGQFNITLTSVSGSTNNEDNTTAIGVQSGEFFYYSLQWAEGLDTIENVTMPVSIEFSTGFNTVTPPPPY